ncbi:Beta-catenin-like protein 1 [Nymphon striatum]|nr:Beta-catenin-like protein 1 [Nymphon striatum]
MFVPRAQRSLNKSLVRWLSEIGFSWQLFCGTSPPKGPKHKHDDDDDDSYDKENSELQKKTRRLSQVPDPIDFESENSSGITEEEREKILKLVEEEPEAEPLDENAVKKLILGFEKRVLKNQELRIKFPDLPVKFMESELDLNETIQELSIIATAPEMYHILVELNSVHTISAVDLLQELTDADIINESAEGANALIDALTDGQIIALLVQNMDRLDESVKEEAQGVHNSLTIIENLTELQPEVSVSSASQGLMPWLLKRIKSKAPFDVNKLYACEILSILLQDQEENKKLIGDLDGIDVLLQQLAYFKRHNPNSAEEREMMENLFNCLCSSLMYAPNRDKFLKGEGLQLMNLMLKEKKLSRNGALKVLDYAMHGADNCSKFIDILGLRTIFPLFMKTPSKTKGSGTGREEHEGLFLFCSHEIRKSILKTCPLCYFINAEGIAVDLINKGFSIRLLKMIMKKLMELHFKYLDKVQAEDRKIDAQN